MAAKRNTQIKNGRASGQSLDRLVRLLDEWDNEVTHWEEASERAYSQGEKIVSMRCNARAYEIAKCRRELEAALEPSNAECESHELEPQNKTDP